MSNNRRLWDLSSRLLADDAYFNSRRDEVLDTYSLLNCHGLGLPKRSNQGRSISSALEIEKLDPVEADELQEARQALRSGGQYENGIRNTLKYFVEGRISLSYRLRGCSQSRRSNNPAPPRHSSYYLKQQVESFLRKKVSQGSSMADSTTKHWYTANGAFICACLMVNLKIWTYRGSAHPDLRIGKPWAVAGLKPEEYPLPDEEHAAKFWRWVVQQDPVMPKMSDFISDTIELLYSGASLENLEQSMSKAGSPASEIYKYLQSEFGTRSSGQPASTMKTSKRIGFLDGQIKVPDDFNQMGAEEIERMFGVAD